MWIEYLFIHWLGGLQNFWLFFFTFSEIEDILISLSSFLKNRCDIFLVSYFFAYFNHICYVYVYLLGFMGFLYFHFFFLTNKFYKINILSIFKKKLFFLKFYWHI